MNVGIEVDKEILLGISIGVLVVSGFTFSVLASLLWNTCPTTSTPTFFGGILLSLTGFYVYQLNKTRHHVLPRQHTVPAGASAAHDHTTSPLRLKWEQRHFYGQLAALSLLLVLFLLVYSDRPGVADHDPAFKFRCYPLNTLFCVDAAITFLVGGLFFAKSFHICPWRGW